MDEAVRRSKQAKVSDETTRIVASRLLAIKPQVESHFGIPLSDCQTPMFLVYQEGDFFTVHQDASEENYHQDQVVRRRVSVVVFLNGESAVKEPDSYEGGSPSPCTV